MAKDNIYDIIITELILRSDNVNSTLGLPTVVITSTIPNTVPANFNGSGVFTSQVYNVPSGYTIDPNSHIITYPIAVPPTIGSNPVLTGGATNVILGINGTTYVVNTTITLIHSTNPPITITGSYTITAVAPMYYGIKAYSSSPDTTGLALTSSLMTSFQMTTSNFGHLYIALPTGMNPLVSVTDPNGLIYTIANDFTLMTNTGYDYYILNYGTQLTGSNVKTFTLNFN